MFRRKRRKSGDKPKISDDPTPEELTVVQACRLVTRFLLTQLKVAGKPEQYKRSIRDPWARGYIYGALDQTYQHYGVVHESLHGVLAAITTIRSVAKLEPGEAEKFYHECVALRGDPDFDAGMMCGSQEMLKLQEGSTTGIWGLGQYLYDGTMLRQLVRDE